MNKYAWLVTIGVVAILLFGSVPAWAQATIHVDDDNCPGPGTGTQADPYCKIQDAINAASPGDVINVNPGTYDGVLTITKPITLSGADKTNTIITYTGSPVEQLVFLGTNTGLDLGGPVVIENFTLYNGGSLTGDNDLLKFRARGVGGQIAIRNNIFDCDGDGSIPSDPGPAKAIEEAYQASNFVITDNEFNKCRYGVWLNGGQNGAISNNTFSGSTSGAIGMGGSDAGPLAPHNLTVSGNTMDNGTFGMVLAQNIHDISFSCNTITNNSYTGVLLWEFGPEDWSNVHINYNNIAGNTSGMQSYYDPGGNPNIAVDAIDNWWGDTSGPGGNGPGTGDAVLLSNVSFNPWLAEEIGDVCPPPSDNEGPTTSNVAATPNPVAVNSDVTVTATVDDNSTGGSTIASAEYSLDGGPWTAMSASDGTFDGVSEDVEATFTASGVAGIYNYDLCVRGTDDAGNTGAPPACTTLMLVVYDPDGGFVTGGGWIESPPDAYKLDDHNTSTLVWNQGFESDTDGWFDSSNSWHGTIARVPSGQGGVTSSAGSYHAVFEGDASGAPFTRFDGYRDTWPGTWVAEIDVYLDPNWMAGQGFDYSVAANGSDGTHQRDYIFHVTKDTSTGRLLVAGSNNTNFAPREDLENINHYEVTTAGWYTFQHVFYETSGALAVDLNLLDANGAVLFTETRFNPADIISDEVGGNRYGWFTFINVTGGIAVDEHQLVVPMGPTGKATFGFVSKYNKKTKLPEGNTEFVFNAADLNFHSSSYDWLVVNQNGTNAQFKGAGTINGEGDYKFMLWAGDGEPDTFRIKIWWEENGTEHVVYDNGMDQPIAGGNIVVHTTKKK